MTDKEPEGAGGRLFHPLAKLFPRMPPDEFAELVEDVKANGLIHPIIIADGMILDGRHRALACEAAGIVPVYRELTTWDSAPDQYVVSGNLMRRNLNGSQRALIATAIHRMQTGGGEDETGEVKPGFLGSGTVEANSPTYLDTSKRKAAEDARVSRTTIGQAETVLDKAAPEIHARVLDGSLSLKDAVAVADLPVDQQRDIAYKPPAAVRAEVKRLRRAETEGAAVAKAQTLSEATGAKRYGVIYADPPWRFEPRSRETGMDRAADNHYPTMDLDDLLDLDVPSAVDCALFLWATVPMLPAALSVMHAWGFEYRSHMAWVKPHAGTGYWWRNRHELLLLGVKGAMPAPVPGNQWGSVLEYPAMQHSSKPGKVREMIESYFPRSNKIELFARDTAPGWDAWGNQLPGQDVTTGAADHE